MVLKAKKQTKNNNNNIRRTTTTTKTTTTTTTTRIHQMLNTWNQGRQKIFLMVKVLRKVKGKKAKKKKCINFGGRKIKEVVAISLCVLLTPAIVDRSWSCCNCGGSIRTLLATCLAQIGLVGTFWTRLTGLKICRKIKSAVGKLPSKTLSYV